MRGEGDVGGEARKKGGSKMGEAGKEDVPSYRTAVYGGKVTRLRFLEVVTS